MGEPEITFSIIKKEGLSFPNFVKDMAALGNTLFPDYHRTPQALKALIESEGYFREVCAVWIDKKLSGYLIWRCYDKDGESLDKSDTDRRVGIQIDRIHYSNRDAARELLVGLEMTIRRTPNEEIVLLKPFLKENDGYFKELSEIHYLYLGTCSSQSSNGPEFTSVWGKAPIKSGVQHKFSAPVSGVSSYKAYSEKWVSWENKDITVSIEPVPSMPDGSPKETLYRIMAQQNENSNTLIKDLISSPKKLTEISKEIRGEQGILDTINTPESGLEMVRQILKRGPDTGYLGV